MNELKDVTGQYTMADCFSNDTSLKCVVLSSLEAITGDYSCLNAFADTGIKDINLDKLGSITGTDACNGMMTNSAIEHLSLPSLKYVNGTRSISAFAGYCNQLTGVDLPELTAVRGDYQ